MSSKDSKKQPEKPKSTSTRSATSSWNDAQSTSGSKVNTAKTTKGSRGFQTGSRFAADPNLVDVPLDDDPPPAKQEEEPGWEKVEFEGHSSHVGQGDHWWMYEEGIGKKDGNKDVDPDYEIVDKPEHSAHNGQGDHPRKYRGGEFVKSEPQHEPEKTLWQRLSSWLR